MHTTKTIFALTTCAGLSACGPSGYLSAADKFGAAATASATTLRGTVSFHHHVCEQRSQIAFVTHSLAHTNTADGLVASETDPPLRWTAWYTTFKNRPTPQSPLQTAEQRCNAPAIGDRLMGDCVAAIAAYAQALQAVAEANYSGTTVGSLLDDVNALATATPGTPAAVTGAIGVLGPTSSGPGAIGQLVGAIEQSYTAHDVKTLIKDTDYSFKVIVDWTSSYLAAVNAEESDLETDTLALFDDLEIAMAAGSSALIPVAAAPGTPEKPIDSANKAPKSKNVAEPPAAQPPQPVRGKDPVALMEFYRFAQWSTQTMALTKEKQSALTDALQKLSQAEDALAKAGGQDDSPSLKTTLGLVSQVLGDIAAVKGAIQGGATQ